jgi:hypothetical protein
MNELKATLDKNLNEMNEFEDKFGSEIVRIVRLMLEWNPLKRLSFSVLKGYIEKV